MAAAVLVTASLFIADRAPQSMEVLGISLVVSAIFVGVGLVLFGIQRHAAATAVAVHGDLGGALRQLERNVTRLVAYLLAGGVFVCVVLALMTLAILERLGQGFAVFG